MYSLVLNLHTFFFYWKYLSNNLFIKSIRSQKPESKDVFNQCDASFPCVWFLSDVMFSKNKLPRRCDLHYVTRTFFVGWNKTQQTGRRPWRPGLLDAARTEHKWRPRYDRLLKTFAVILLVMTAPFFDLFEGWNEAWHLVKLGGGGVIQHQICSFVCGNMLHNSCPALFFYESDLLLLSFPLKNLYTRSVVFSAPFSCFTVNHIIEYFVLQVTTGSLHSVSSFTLLTHHSLLRTSQGTHTHTHTDTHTHTQLPQLPTPFG